MFSICSDDSPVSPWPIAKRLLKSHPELSTLSDGLDAGWTLAFVLRYGDWNRQGRMTLGTCGMPTVSGSYRDLFEWLLEDRLGYFPTFLITLNEEWWLEAGDRRREILLFHEMLHAGQAVDKFGEPRFHRETGAPIPSIVGHDVEEFTAVVARYGAWKSDLGAFLDAARRHQAGYVEHPLDTPIDLAAAPPEAVFD